MNQVNMSGNLTNRLREDLMIGSVAAMVLLAMTGTGAQAGGFLSVNFDWDDFAYEADGVTPHDPLDIDNRFWPLVPGTTFEYFADADDECEVNRVTVTTFVKNDFPAGTPYEDATARVVEDLDWVDEDCDGSGDVLAEKTYDWYAQDNAGNVWYLGEDTEAYLDDEGDPLPVPDPAGSWTAGEPDGEGGIAKAGIVMPGDPVPGLWYEQEYFVGEAEDMAKVLRDEMPVEIDLGDYGGCLKTKEWTPLDSGAIEHKYYCPGTGLVLIQELKQKTLWVELISVSP